MKKGLTVKKGGLRLLNGQPFIAAETKDDPKKELTPTEVLYTPTDGVVQRTCRNCFYRGEMGSVYATGKGDCHLACNENDGNPAKKIFNIGSGTMPINIDGQPVGNYCPFWLDFRDE